MEVAECRKTPISDCLNSMNHEQNSCPETKTSLSIARVLMVLIASGLFAMFGRGFFSSLKPPEGAVMDFYKEWNSARNWRFGTPVYANHRETLERDLGIDPHRFQFHEEYNTHPPTAILPALPLAWFPYPQAHLIWNLFSLAAFGASLGLIFRECRINWSFAQFLLLAAMLLICDPFRQTLNQGQLNAVLLLCLVGGWVADRHGRIGWTGFCIALASGLKLFPALLIFYFAARRQWKTVAAILGWGLVLFLLTVAVLGPAGFADYLQGPIHQLGPYVNEWGNVSIVAFWERLFGVPTYRVEPFFFSPLAKTLGIAFTDLLLLAVIGRWAWTAKTRRECDRAYAAFLVAMILLSPIAWGHYFLLLTLPLLLLFGDEKSRPRTGPAMRVLLFFVVASVWLTPLLFWRPLLGTVSASAVASRPSLPQHAQGYRGQFAEPIESLTLLSYQFYTLWALLSLLSSKPIFRREPALKVETRSLPQSEHQETALC